MTVQLINCKKCLSDNHNECIKSEFCLCANNNHGVQRESILGTFDSTKPLTNDIEIMEKPREKWFQCTHCDSESQSFKAFEFCKKKRHEIITIYVPVDGENEDNSKPFTNEQWPQVALEIQNRFHIVTVRETKEMWINSDEERKYIPNADTYIEEESHKLISNCNTKSVSEIKNAIRAKTLILKIPYDLFYILLWIWSLFDRDPPFTLQQLKALTASDEFEVIDWPGIFNVPYTPFSKAINVTFNDPEYSKVILDF